MGMGALERLSPARVLGDMTLVAKLDEGGMASVYLAAVGRGSLARLVAVKLLRADLVDEDLHTRFLDEARVVVRLQHNNLVNVRTAGEIDGQLYIAMEAIEGRNLADLWDRCAELGKAFPIPLAVYMVREVLRGLHYAHTFPGLSLVHRDVSPSNILLDWAGAVRLADFGLATSTVKDSMTLPGVVFGKIGYMSPEAATRQVVDRRTDIYACGVVLWELLTGRPLRSAEDLDTSAVARFKATPPSKLSRRVDEDLDVVVMRALKSNRDDRWPSADAMMGALTKWLAAHSPETGQEDLAAFMHVLFGEFQAKERSEREALLRSVVRQVGEVPSPLRTPLPNATVPPAGAADPSKGKAVDGVPAQGVRIDSGPSGLTDALAEGTVVADRYRILARIGRGGMGAVYLAEHVTVGRSVAIKVLSREWSRNTAVAERFRAEARAASAAGHPNIIEVFDAGELPDGRLYLVMEFISGRNLYEVMRETGPFEPVRACQIMREVIRAIRAAHDVGVIHRDLKPDNVMLVERGEGEVPTVKVLDFGISASAERSPEQQRLTMPGHAVGTPEYMAPEQARGHAATESFDIYAIGVIFYELLAGNPPFFDANFVEVMARKTTERSEPLSSRRSGLVDDLYQLIDQTLEIDPSRRPASAAEMLARVEGVLRTYTLQASQAALLQQHGPPMHVPLLTREVEIFAGVDRKSRALRWMLAGVGAVAVVAAGVGLARIARNQSVTLNEQATRQAAALPIDAGTSSGGEGPDETQVAVLTEGATPRQDAGKYAALPSNRPDLVEAIAKPNNEPTSPSLAALAEGAVVEDDGAEDEAEARVSPRSRENCERGFAQLEAAISAGENGLIIPRVRLLQSSHCFRTPTERRLKVHALVRAYRELKRWDECVRVAKSSRRDPEIAADYELCSKRQAEGSGE